ncbi:MAG: hypothetical protein EX341_09605 [Candidatus Scalindua sp. SCAELEC01]|nr:MAG: hypothetical protein EX341_09605 [Candidatus Scalindua sp. SCAELEC01]
MRTIMPITMFVVFVFFVISSKGFCSSIAFAKSEYVKIEKGRISVVAKEESLREIVKTIEKKTGTVFTLMGEIKVKEVSAKFSELPLLEGIKKLVYPYNYVIIQNGDKIISKVIVLDITRNSQSRTYNNGFNVVAPTNPEGSGYADTQMENSDVRTFSEDRFDRTEHPPIVSTQSTHETPSQTSDDQENKKSGDSGAGIPSSGGTSISPQQGEVRVNGNTASTQFGTSLEREEGGNACGTGFYFNDGYEEEWRLLGLYDGEEFESIPKLDTIAPFDSSENAPGDTPYHDSLNYNRGSISLSLDGESSLESPTGSNFVHWVLISPDLSGDNSWQKITSFSYDIKNDIISEDGKVYVQAVLRIKKTDLIEKEYRDKHFRDISEDNEWKTYRVDVKALEIPEHSTILSVNLRVSFEASKSYKGDIRVDNVVPFGSKGCSGEITTLIKLGENWKYLKGDSLPKAGWNDISFDDSEWSVGKTSIGYGDGEFETELSDMKDNYKSVYTRKTFDIKDPTAVTDMILRLDYDDGFIAYINGQEVARAYMSKGETDHETEALEHGSGLVEVFDITEHRSNLIFGTNVLAIEIHNESKGSTDLALSPELEIKVQP